MGYAAERAAIEDRLSTYWTTTRIKWPNVAFEPGTATAFIEPWIVNATGQQASLGNPAIERTPGVLSINVRVRQGTGAATAKTYADTLAALFRWRTISGITFRSPDITQVGDVDGWYLVNVSIPFFRDEVITLT